MNNNRQLDFNSKNEEAAYYFDQLGNASVSFDYCPEYDPKGYPEVKAIWFTGARCGGRQTKVFAYIGFPSNISGEIPAVVLQHGGGGTAYPNWVKMWNDRGYAAIAVGNTGFYPASKGIGDFYDMSNWSHTLSERQLAGDHRILPPDNDGLSTSQGDLDGQWMFHAVSQGIIASNILRSFDMVDNDKIGITGISWGGVITSVTIGYDESFAFAIPVYASPYLTECLGFIGENFSFAGTAKLWEPSLNIDKITLPTLWLGWSSDSAFSINSNSKAYLNTSGNSVFSSKIDLGHSHPDGWRSEEIYRFADSVVKEGLSLTVITQHTENARNVSLTVNKPSDAVSVTAKVYYIKSELSYSGSGDARKMDQEWFSEDCAVSGNDVTVTLPNDAHSYYIEITTMVANGQSFITTSEFR